MRWLLYGLKPDDALFIDHVVAVRICDQILIHSNAKSDVLGSRDHLSAYRLYLRLHGFGKGIESCTGRYFVLRGMIST